MKPLALAAVCIIVSLSLLPSSQSLYYHGFDPELYNYYQEEPPHGLRLPDRRFYVDVGLGSHHHHHHDEQPTQYIVQQPPVYLGRK